jgi:PAS domain S-box-containing protein
MKDARGADVTIAEVTGAEVTGAEVTGAGGSQRDARAARPYVTDGDGGEERGVIDGASEHPSRSQDVITGEWQVDTAHRNLLDNLPVLVFRWSVRGSLLRFVNRAFTRMLGYPVEHAYERGLAATLVDDVSRARFASWLERAAAGWEVPWSEITFAAADGRRVATRMMLYPVLSERGTVDAVEGIARDVQAEIDARRKLAHTDRLAAIGQLAAGIAHEINNPAAFVSLNLQMLARAVGTLRADGGDPATLAAMERILTDTSEGMQRIVSIVGELKQFARIPEGARMTPLDVNGLVQSAVTLTRAELRDRARIELDLGRLPPIVADHARLVQVLVNLLFNAAHAIPPGAPSRHVVRVETRMIVDRIRIRVEDTGVGIPPEVLPHIFDPFFTTWGEGGLIGLGLSLSADFVRRMGGAIEVESSPGRGSVFVVELPIDAAESVPSTDEVSEPPARRPRVLVVEDERALAAIIARHLAAEHEVVLAYDAASAERALGEATFDAVLCDLRLPDALGTDVHAVAVARDPSLARHFILVTGAALDPTLDAFCAEHGVTLLEKPFDAATLVQTVRRATAGRERPPGTSSSLPPRA